MSRNDQASVLDLVRAAPLVVEFRSNLDKSAFLTDLKTQSAILHQLLIFGEAAKRLSDAFRAHHSAIPWKLMAGMRDKLIHAYDEVDLEEVWKTATIDIPRLLPALETLAPSDPASQS